MTKREKVKKLILQKLMGLGMLALSAIIILVASKGVSAVDRDATAIVITIPMGLYLLFTKHIVIM